MRGAARQEANEDDSGTRVLHRLFPLPTWRPCGLASLSLSLHPPLICQWRYAPDELVPSIDGREGRKEGRKVPALR